MNVGRHMLLRVRHTLLQLDSEDGGERIFDAQLSDARLTWQFNLRSFLRFTVQRQQVKRNLALCLRTRGRPDRGDEKKSSLEVDE